MKKKSYLYLLSFISLSLFVLLFSFLLKGKFLLESFSSPSFTSYSIEKILLNAIGHNSLFISKGKLEREVESLSYVDKAEIEYLDGNIILSLLLSEDGVIITDRERYYFYSGSLTELDSRDSSDLRKKYTLLEVSSFFLNSLIDANSTNEEIKMLDTLKSLRQSSLITKAEYGNNNSSIYSGSLRLFLDSIECVVIVDDIRFIERLDEALDILQEDYLSSKERLGEKENEFILSSSSLTKLR